MHFALLLFVPAGVGLSPGPLLARAAAPVALVTTYNAFVATEETPATRDLAKPAVLIDQKRDSKLTDGLAWISIS